MCAWGEKLNGDALHPMDNLAPSLPLGFPHLNEIGTLRGIDHVKSYVE